MRELIQKFLRLESLGGIALFAMAFIAMVWANSPFFYIYEYFSEVAAFWINEGLMTIFFLLVGLELKRHYLEERQENSTQIFLPLVAALGGMIIPALIYLVINHGDWVTSKGWATPVATDIAFALGVLSLFGRRIPISLKLFLLALAIFDDIGAMIIIAFFYSQHLASLPLFIAIVLCLGLLFCNQLNIQRLSYYLLFGICLWLSLLYSGIHPTLAGVLLALAIPGNFSNFSLLQQLENRLHPWVVYFIMPLFALANAGLSFYTVSFNQLMGKVWWGIVLGLFLGKQLGVFGFSWLFIRLGYAKLPSQSSWLAFYGVALLCGIGFTMSLFLGTLSFHHENYLAEVRFGVIIGSIFSGLLGGLVLLTALSKNKNQVINSNNFYRGAD